MRDGPLAFYIHSLRSGRGAEGVVINLARALAARGHEVDLLLEDMRGTQALDNSPRLKLIDLRRTGGGTFAGHWWRIRCLARNLTRPARQDPLGSAPFLKSLARFLYKRKPPLCALSRYLEARRPAAIVSFLNYPNMALLLAAQAGAGESQVMVNVRNHISSSVMNAKSRRMREMPVLMRNFFCHAERVIAPARDVGEDIARLTDTPMEKVSILYNPVYRDEIITAAEAPSGHPWLDSPVDEPVILAAGKMMPQKDFATLLKAFAAFRAKQPAKLIVLGEGAGRAALLALARDLAIEGDVDFPGHVDNPYAYYRRAALFVLSSAWEGLPNVLLEAMALGCPVVSTDCPGGAAEILDEGRYGRLVPVGDSQALAEAMRQTLDQPLPKETLIGRARDFSLEAVVEAYERVLFASPGSNP